LRSARASSVLSGVVVEGLLSIGAAVDDGDELGLVVVAGLGVVLGVVSLGAVVLGGVVLGVVVLGGVVGSGGGVVFCARAMPPAVNRTATAEAALRVWVDLRMVGSPVQVAKAATRQAERVERRNGCRFR
jgi:hypothetical protein